MPSSQALSRKRNDSQSLASWPTKTWNCFYRRKKEKEAQQREEAERARAEKEGKSLSRDVTITLFTC